MKKIAICYDFDKTLSPYNMQEQGFFQAIGCTAKDFWGECSLLSSSQLCEGNHAYLLKMIERSKGKVKLTEGFLNSLGTKIVFFDGVETWFDRINQFAADIGAQVFHYVISSGNKEIIDGTKIRNKLSDVYASRFLYDENGIAYWPAMVVNYTNKTQFLFRISKGIENPVSDDVNDKVLDFEIPFNNFIYIGDSDTDVPCMQLIKNYGGASIGVYDPALNNDERVKKMLIDRRIESYVPADYTDGSPLDKIVKKFITKCVLSD